MSNIWIIIGVILISIVIILSTTSFPAKEQKAVIKFDQLSHYFSSLQQSNNKYAFLIIATPSPEDFVQFTADEKGFQLDFPAISERQKELEKDFNNVATSIDLKVIQNKGSDNSTFFDIEINEESKKVAVVTKKIMMNLFKISEDSDLHLTWVGFTP